MCTNSYATRVVTMVTSFYTQQKNFWTVMWLISWMYLDTRYLVVGTVVKSLLARQCIISISLVFSLHTNKCVKLRKGVERQSTTQQKSIKDLWCFGPWNKWLSWICRSRLTFDDITWSKTSFAECQVGLWQNQGQAKDLIILLFIMPRGRIPFGHLSCSWQNWSAEKEWDQCYCTWWWSHAPTHDGKAMALRI